MSIPTSSPFSALFPGNAMVNSLLATSYISIIPNLLLYFAPPDIAPSTLNVLANFAVGSLLGDVFLHLLPHCFQSHEHHQEEEKHHHGNDHKNVVIGIGIFAGLFLFYAADKCMRAYFGRSGHDHDHHHHHHDEKLADQVDKKTENNLRQRKTNKKNDDDVKEVEKKKSDIRASTYLNLVADFTHNLTDGIAMAASFYASPAVGATTAVAVFFHEIPHEISDFAILLKSGFSKRRAMMAQFTTAVGAYIGTLIGIGIEELAFRLDHAHHHQGLLGTGMAWGDLIMPVTAGGFLYIATVGVIPELLEGTHASNSKVQPVKELLAMVFGMAVMATIAWNEQHHH
ncbi:Zinc/iron permease [Backusella circina FSU 941]|nr:Zinc/iron permease [Backusella circina FSU 941]